MSDALEFDEDAVEWIARLYRTRSMTRRRAFVREQLAPAPGDAVLSVGTGPGYEPRGLARAVGAAGRVHGVDPSRAMLAATRRRCSDQPQVTVEAGTATALPVPDRSFQRATAVQVLEYVDDVDAAVAELHRALVPGGRAVVVDTDWDTAVFNAADDARSARVLRAYEAHCRHPRIARRLRPTLEGAGFDVVDVVPYTHCETAPDGTGGAMAELVRDYVAARGDLEDGEADAWLADVRTRGEAGAFFFSFSQYAFVVERPDE